ncbi:MAG: sensor histidine kinase [Chloroflexi bacterium]|nr:sensor histidine kinase [Chloroflexota bacterium]MCL5275407.1 sensor histidine kinase [Chloroflexota bacterium]
MKQVIGLVRLTLLLRVATSIIGAIVALTFLPLATPVLVDLVAVVPSLILLLVVFIASLRGWGSPHFVKSLLVAVIIVEAMEAILSRVGFQLASTALGINEGAFFRRIPGGLSEWTLMRLPLNVPLLFITIPALLGAWIDGRRRAVRWAIFTAIMIMLSTISTDAPEFTQWRLNVGVFGAQAIVVLITTFFVATLADQQRAEQVELETANRKLAEQALVREQLATTRERVRLSRDLHDTLAHTLAGLVVQAKVVDTLLDKDPAAARRELARVQAVAKQGLEDARAAISDLRANMVEDMGLGNALQRQAELLGQRSGLQVSYEHSGDDPQLDNAHAETLLRIVQEALHNIERHANASHVSVCLEQTPLPDRMLTIRVKDDGIGFDVSSLDDERFGLRGMRERAELIGAHLRIDSIVGAGTMVSVTIRQN